MHNSEVKIIKQQRIKAHAAQAVVEQLGDDANCYVS